MANRTASRSVRRWLPAVAIGLAALGALWAGARRWVAGPVRDDHGHWRAVAMGRAALARGRPDRALEAVELVRDEAPGSGEAMTVAGLALLQLHDVKAARLALERALKLQPDQLDAARALAELYLRLGNGTRGIELLRTVTRLDPGDRRAWLVMGRVAHDLGDPETAARAYEQSLRLRPDDRETRLALIRELLSGHQPDRAAPYLTRALREWPDDARALTLAALRAREAGRGEEAAAMAGRALARDPDNLDALLIRARAHLLGGRDEQALADLERAVAAHPHDVGALQLLAQVETRLHLTERAAATLERHRRARDRAILMDQLVEEIAKRPDDPVPRFRLGQAAAEGGSALLAARCFRAALALDPSFRPAREALKRSATSTIGRPRGRTNREDARGDDRRPRPDARDGTGLEPPTKRDAESARCDST